MQSVKNLFLDSYNMLSPSQLAKRAGVSRSKVMTAIQKKQLAVIRGSVVMLTGTSRLGPKPKFLISKENADVYIRNERNRRKLKR